MITRHLVTSFVIKDQMCGSRELIDLDKSSMNYIHVRACVRACARVCLCACACVRLYVCGCACVRICKFYTILAKLECYTKPYMAVFNC